MDGTLYKSSDYKAFLKAKIHERKSQRGYQTRLADAAGCQKSFISQVLKSHVHLTMDHGARLCRFWKLDDNATDFFLTLLEYGRAGSIELKGLLEKKLRRARRQAELVASRFEKATPGSKESMAEYYSTWYMAAIHVLVSVPGYQNPSAISKRLQLPEEIVKASLESLKAMELVDLTMAGWKVTKGDVFLPKGSNLTKAYHSTWRQKAISALQVEPLDSIHYTTVYAMSRQDIVRVREIFLDAIEKARDLMLPSPEEDLVCVMCDVFRI